MTNMENLVTASGQVFACDYFNPAPELGQINIRIIGVPMPTVAAVFTDPAETAALQWGDVVAEKYTRWIAFSREAEAIRVVLRRE